MKLDDSIYGAPNFTIPELTYSYTARRLGIDNTPDEASGDNLVALAKECLQPIRDTFGRINVLSGYRCFELNKAVGGSDTSNHLRGEAADIEPEVNISLLTITKWICQNLSFRELIAEFFPNGWIHIAYRKGSNIRELKLKDSTHDYTTTSLLELMDLYPQA